MIFTGRPCDFFIVPKTATVDKTDQNFCLQQATTINVFCCCASCVPTSFSAKILLKTIDAIKNIKKSKQLISNMALQH